MYACIPPSRHSASIVLSLLCSACNVAIVPVCWAMAVCLLLRSNQTPTSTISPCQETCSTATKKDLPHTTGLLQ